MSNNCGVPSLEVPDQLLEVHIIGVFKVWHIIFIVIALLVTIAIVYCCFHRCRIPRTKQEIEADSMRANLAKKFREHLQELPVEQTSFMDVLKKVQELEDLKKEHENEDGAGPKKRMGWLKMLGKVETINKEDGDDMLLEKKSEDLENPISSVVSLEMENNDQQQTDKVDNNPEPQPEKAINTKPGFSSPEETESVRQIRSKLVVGEKLNRTERKRIDQVDRALKKAKKEAEKLAKLNNKLLMKKEKLELIEQKKKEKVAKLEEEKLLREEKKAAKLEEEKLSKEEKKAAKLEGKQLKDEKREHKKLDKSVARTVAKPDAAEKIKSPKVPQTKPKRHASPIPDASNGKDVREMPSRHVHHHSEKRGRSKSRRHHSTLNKEDRSRLKRRVLANQDDATIKIRNPEMREIYQTIIDIDKLRK